ncbi:MAG: hypothetical protein Q8O92_00995 [Candidatus Latescibacter sp.]|nr:hypothetical protein [Candidatus Latescibacter sp.]
MIVMGYMSVKRKTKKLSEREIDQLVMKKADDDSAWGKSIHVRRTKPASKRVEIEEAAFAGAKHDIAKTN